MMPAKIQLFGRFLVLAILILDCHCQDSSPLQFTQNMDGYEISERLPQGTNVYVLRGTSSNSGQISYEIESEYFNIPAATDGKVYLTQQLDYESNTEIEARVRMRQGSDVIEELVTVTVIDKDDEAPYFTQSEYIVQVAEGTVVNTRIVRDVTVVDPDTVNTGITVGCFRSPNQDIEPCDYFDLVSTSANETTWVGDLVLRRSLDFEQIPSFSFTAFARDQSGNSDQSTTQAFDIRVQDEQDTAPVLTSSPNAVVSENSPANTLITQITAQDGDSQNPREVRYELISNTDLFSLNSRTGELTNLAPIESGIISLQVQVCEVYNSTHTYTGRNDCRDVQMRITVTDVNDHAPRFSRTDYTAEIEENVEDGTPFLTVQVSDDDQGANAVFELRLVNYDDIFTVMPTRGTGSLTASIYVSDTSKIDHESGTTNYVIQLEARETETAEALSSFAFVDLTITDENDNEPEFAQDQYEATVLETATAGTPVITITATDADSSREGGVQSIRYKLVGNGADRFSVNIRTGAVTVRSCSTPGSGNCLNAENVAQYDLFFYAGDSFGEGFISKVPLRITIGNANDNQPVFLLDEYVAFIREGQTSPYDPEVLQVSATDDDEGDVIRYAIISGNTGDPPLWQIGETSGIITARVPVDFEAIPGNRDFYQMTVECTDGINVDTTTVRIIVIDVNEHPPVFTPAFYREFISEDTAPGTVVETVSATDEDSSTMPNGEIRYRITSGALDKFEIEPESGVVTVAPGATFDYDVRTLYDMTILALDQGQPQRSATATLEVHIRDTNNKSPYFQPSTVRAEIAENQPVGTEVIQMTAIDPDQGSSLVYYLQSPRSAFTSRDQPVDPATVPNFDEYFSIEQVSGMVRVNNSLDYSTIARYHTTVKAVDNAGGADQTALATLIITILQVNTKPPEFQAPWTPDNPVINVDAREGQAPGSYVTTLVATDETDAVEYRIISDPGDYFDVDPTGVVTTKRPIDYESDEQLRFTAVAVDNGQPPLTSQATVNINVQNVNDETPKFDQGIYNEELGENSPGGTVVTQVRATDADKDGPGMLDYGTVRYAMDDPLNRFTINNVTGQITVVDGAVLDREKEPLITLTVTAYDSPSSPPNDRRYNSVNVYVTLRDDNDNAPKFTQSFYSAVIFENVPEHSPVIELGANDEDEEGPNSELTFYEIRGDELGMFEVEPDTGMVRTRNGSILGLAGEYTVTFGVTDKGVPALFGTTDVTISVLQTNNLPPRWIVPSVNNYTAEVLENEYEGTEIIRVVAEDPDEDRQSNDGVEYGFFHLTQFVNKTDDFSINPLTGVITGNRIFDREERPSYTLLLMARDRGDPPLASTRYLIINIKDQNDNIPEFPSYSNCCSIPITLRLSENTRYNPPLRVGTIVAKDRDEKQMINYTIVDGNEDKSFYLDASTGELMLQERLRYEVKNFYTLTIEAVDAKDGNLSPPPAAPQCRCKGDLSRTLLYIHVIDVNEYAPEWPARHTACISKDAEIGTLVTILEAIDRDTGNSDNVTYHFTNFTNYHSRNNGDTRTAPNNSFVIGDNNGSVYSNTVMERYEDHYFQIEVTATDMGDVDKTSETELMIWVTNPTDEVTLVFDRPPDEVNEDREDIVKMISELTNGGIVCISDVRYHVTGENVVNRERTDLTFHVISNSSYVVMDPDRVVGILEKSDRFIAAFGIIDIHTAHDVWDGFVIDPVVAAIAVILFLLLLLLLLLCLCCLCLGFCAKSSRYYKPLYIGTINPLWSEKGLEDQELTMRVKEFEGIEPSGALPLGAINTAFERDTVDAGYGRTEKWTYESSQTQANGTVVGAGGMRIEAPLEGQSVTSFGSAQPRHRSAATMTDDEMSDVGSGLHNRSGASGFGATLTRSGVAVERIYGESGSSIQGSDIVDLTQHGGSVSMFPGGSMPRTDRHYRSATLPSQRSYMVESNELVHDLSAPEVYSDGGFIAPVDQYQGQINLGTFSTVSEPTRGVKKTYVERRETTEYLN